MWTIGMVYKIQRATDEPSNRNECVEVVEELIKGLEHVDEQDI